jgi:hypothetical protein
MSIFKKRNKKERCVTVLNIYLQFVNDQPKVGGGKEKETIKIEN